MGILFYFPIWYLSFRFYSILFIAYSLAGTHVLFVKLDTTKVHTHMHAHVHTYVCAYVCTNIHNTYIRMYTYVHH